MAERIYQETGRVDEVYVRILSQIGRPITKPLIISIQYTALDNLDEKSFAYEAAEIAKDQIRRITELEKLVLEQKVMLF